MSEDPTFSRPPLQLVRGSYQGTGQSMIAQQPLRVEEWRTRYAGFQGYYEQVHDTTLPELLTQIVQALEKLGVEFSLVPARAEPARVEVKIKREPA